MYFESRGHRSRPVASADEAAKLIFRREAADYDALVWTAPHGRRLAAVADGHIDNLWFEVAIIALDSSPPVQIESITFGWMKGIDEAIDYLRQCETTAFSMGATGLPLDGQGEVIPARFECGCCGQWFVSTIAAQRRFDQDSGYGICAECSRQWP